MIKAVKEQEAYNPGYPVQTADECYLSDLDLGKFLSAEYLSILDSNEPYQTKTS